MPGQRARKLILIATLAAIALAAALVGLRLAEQTQTDGPREAMICETRLRLAPGLARFPIVRRGGLLERLDLAVSFPDFRPAGDRASAGKAALFITLSAADRAVEPADRPTTLYARFLAEEIVERADGLAMRRFQPGSPYEFEDLYIAPPEGRAFAARCTRPKQPPDGLPETCLTDLRLGGLDAQLRYAPELLPRWELLVSGARALIETMKR